MSYPAIGSKWRNRRSGEVCEVIDAGGGMVTLLDKDEYANFIGSDDDGNPLGYEPVSSDQPAPVANNLPAAWPAVIADMQARDALGRERYGVPLQPCNGRNALLDAYEESLDKTAYLKAELMTREVLRELIDEALDACRWNKPGKAMEFLKRALELLPVGRGE